MAAKTKTTKPVIINAETVRALRAGLGLNQSQFWSALGVTQSGGSRYESGRDMPKPVKKLLWVMYLSPLAAAAKTDNVIVHADIFMARLKAI